jgi:hypothetical protein
MSDTIHPACALCKGACCEGFALNPRAWGWPDDVSRWLEFHGERSVLGVEFDKPCKHKCSDGKCGIYYDDDRPAMCASFEVGSEACLHCIKTKRIEQSEEILRKIT